MVEEVRRQVKELRGDAYDEKSGADGQDDDQWTVFKNDIAEAKHNVDFWNKELVRLKEENEKKSDEIFATPPEKYAACIKIATDASLQEMIAPAAWSFLPLSSLDFSLECKLSLDFLLDRSYLRCRWRFQLRTQAERGITPKSTSADRIS